MGFFTPADTSPVMSVCKYSNIFGVRGRDGYCTARARHKMHSRGFITDVSVVSRKDTDHDTSRVRDRQQRCIVYFMDCAVYFQNKLSGKVRAWREVRTSPPRKGSAYRRCVTWQRDLYAQTCCCCFALPQPIPVHDMESSYDRGGGI